MHSNQHGVRRSAQSSGGLAVPTIGEHYLS